MARFSSIEFGIDFGRVAATARGRMEAGCL